MTKPVKIDDIQFVNAELQKLLGGHYPDFNDWERGFLLDMARLIELNVSLTAKQVFNLYKAYFKHVEGDESELEDWAREHGMMHLMRTS